MGVRYGSRLGDRLPSANRYARRDIDADVPNGLGSCSFDTASRVLGCGLIEADDKVC